MRQTQVQTRPQLIQAMVDAFGQPDLRRRLLFTLGILVVFRFIAHVAIPGVERDALRALFQQNALLGMLDLFSGGAMRNLSVAALGVYPYITASIIMQLLVPVIPPLQALSREGEAGRNKVNQITHCLIIPLAMLQGYGQLVFMQSQRILVPITLADGTVTMIEKSSISGVGLSGDRLLPTLAMVLSMTAGTILLVWLGERITESGIGNGISLIIFGGIVAALPERIGRVYLSTGLVGVAKLVLLLVAIAVFIVFVVEAQRRIPVQYARSLFRGGRMYRQAGASHIPLRVNSAGMIPLIFAMSIMVLPGTIASYFVAAENPWVANGANFISGALNPNGFPGDTGLLYWTLFFILAVGFTFFYTVVIFQQQDLAETLQRQGGFVPGIRPGRPTAEYLNRVILRITWGGAIFLGLIAIMPLLSRWIAGMPGNVPVMIITSTGLLIVVGVVLDTMRQLEAQLLMRRYEGFIR